jgi:hypothetical protein
MERRISPGSTFFMKFLFPPLWPGFLVVWVHLASNDPKFPEAEKPLVILIFPLVMFFGGLTDFVRYHFPLKRVWIVDGGLRVSDYRRTIDVPFRAIESITQLCNNNFRYITIRLREDTAFGRRFTMLPLKPRMTWPVPSGEDDIVFELRKLAKLGLGEGGIAD